MHLPQAFSCMSDEKAFLSEYSPVLSLSRCGVASLSTLGMESTWFTYHAIPLPFATGFVFFSPCFSFASHGIGGSFRKPFAHVGQSFILWTRDFDEQEAHTRPWEAYGEIKIFSNLAFCPSHWRLQFSIISSFALTAQAFSCFAFVEDNKWWSILPLQRNCVG